MTIDSLTVANIGIGTITFISFFAYIHYERISHPDILSLRKHKHEPDANTMNIISISAATKFIAVILLLLVIKSIYSVMSKIGSKKRVEACSRGTSCHLWEASISWPFSSENSLKKTIFLILGIYLFGMLLALLKSHILDTIDPERKVSDGVAWLAMLMWPWCAFDDANSGSHMCSS